MKWAGIRSIARNATYLIAGRGVTYIFRSIYIVVLARYLGPEIYGLFAYGQAWYAPFLFLTLLGLGGILVREVGRDREGAAPVVAQTLALRLLAVAIAAPACLLVGWLVETNALALKIIAIFSLAIIGRGLAIWVEHLFIGYESSQYAFRLEASFRLLEVALGVTLLMLGGGVLAVAAVHAVTWWLQAARGLFLVRRKIIRVRPAWHWRGFRRLLSQGVPMGLHGMLSVWMMQAPLLLYRHVAGSDGALGQLALAMQATLLLSVVPSAVAGAALPVLSRATARQDGKERLFMDKLLPLAILVGALLGLSGMGAGPWLVDLLFGPKYAQAGDLLGAAMWLLIPISWATVAIPVLFVRGQVVRPMIIGLAGAVVVTIGVPVLVEIMGMPGAIAAAGAGLSIWALGLFGLLTKFSRRDVDRSIVRPGLAALVALATYFALEPAGNWTALAVSVPALLGVSVVLRVFGSPRHALETIRMAILTIPRL